MISNQGTEMIRELPWIVNDEEMSMLFCAGIASFKSRSVLDVGMLLKRIGAVSRSFQDFYLSDDVMLYGIDLVKERIPIYENIYNEIADRAGYSKIYSENRFDLVYIFDIEKLITDFEYENIWKWCTTHTERIFTDDIKMATAAGKAVIVKMDYRDYYIIDYSK